ncbi:MAG: hypothetical protein RIF36_03675 [Imperialibacter sp.]|uniref:hypothetical protein n=2 Tax=Imperialibacter sp. TaxID=2038411 RepID=UPI0032EB75BC
MKAMKILSRNTVLLMVGYVVLKWTIIISAGTYLYSSGNWRNEYFLFFPLLAVIVIGIKNRKRLFSKKKAMEENAQDR